MVYGYTRKAILLSLANPSYEEKYDHERNQREQKNYERERMNREPNSGSSVLEDPRLKLTKDRSYLLTEEAMVCAGSAFFGLVFWPSWVVNDVRNAELWLRGRQDPYYRRVDERSPPSTVGDWILE